MRRVQCMLRRVFQPSFVIRVAALDLPNYNRVEWWKNNDLIFDFEIETMKYLNYGVKYSALKPNTEEYRG
jgi:hypothetical protein